MPETRNVNTTDEIGGALLTELRAADLTPFLKVYLCH